MGRPVKILSELLQGINYEWDGNGTLSLPIERVVSDSRAVREGDLFVAMVGPNQDGHQFIDQAVRQGASAVISEKGREPSTFFCIPHLRVSNTREAFGILLSQYYGRAHEQIRLIGITGTNGKTTTAHVIYYLLNRVGSSCGMIGTIEYLWKDKKRRAFNTTPGQATLIPLLSEMVGDGVAYCVSEVSSHALDQGRTSGLKFSTVIFTNLTQDHMDYHKNFEHYYASKRKLFIEEPVPKCRIVNIDDFYGKRLLQEIGNNAISYGKSEQATYRVSNISVSLTGSEFDLFVRGKKHRIKTNLPLYHNVYNILATLATLSEMGFAIDELIPLLQNFPGVAGRMERVDEGQAFHVFIDYAHTPDAFQNVFSCVKPLAKGKIISVFGCGGNRDRSKRPLMGRIASESSAVIFLTNDNPRQEKSSAIIDEILEGIPPSSNALVYQVEDRHEAIQEAIESAQPDDLVLILGKGHETEQIIGNQTFPFSDATVARECLKECLKVPLNRSYANH